MSSDAGSAACAPCPAGTAAVQGLCQACPPDTWSQSGQSACAACPPPQDSATDCVRAECAGGVRVVVNDDTETPPADDVACTVEACANGRAVSVPVHALCDDDDPCTTEQCTATGCLHTRREDCVVDAGLDAGADAGFEDAGVDGGAIDAGSDAPTPATPSGCGCAQLEGVLVVVAALGLVSRRRRRG